MLLFAVHKHQSCQIRWERRVSNKRLPPCCHGPNFPVRLILAGPMKKTDNSKLLHLSDMKTKTSLFKIISSIQKSEASRKILSTAAMRRITFTNLQLKIMLSSCDWPVWGRRVCRVDMKSNRPFKNWACVCSDLSGVLK